MTWSEEGVRPHVVGVVLPARNEAGHIGGVVDSMPPWVDHIYVVDDASSDGTAEAAGAVGDRRLTVITLERNAGVGGAMIAGYHAGVADGCDVLVKMDADGQMRTDELQRLVEPIVRGLAEYAKGNRFLVVGRTGSMPAHRKAGGVVLSLVTKMASGYWHVFDAQCGYTAVRADYLSMIQLDDVAKDYFFENDMLIRLNATGARVVDVPAATIYGDEVSDVRIGRVALTFPPRLARGWLRRVTRKYMVADFGAIGLLILAGLVLCLFGTAFGAYHWIESVAEGYPASTGTVMIAVLPLMVGVMLLLQAFAMEVTESPGAIETRSYLRELAVRSALR